MARPRKTGLFYFPFDVDFFHDKRMRILRIKFGAAGVLLYEYILCSIYDENGYYVELNEDFYDCAVDDVGISESEAREIIGYLCKRSRLFDEELAETEGILTSEEIQRTFQEAKKGLRRDVKVSGRYWLVPKDETLGFIKSEDDVDFYGENGNKYGKNGSKSCINDINKIKENQIKLYKSKAEESAYAAVAAAQEAGETCDNEETDIDVCIEPEDTDDFLEYSDDEESVIGAYEENVARVLPAVRRAIKERIRETGTDTVIYAIDEAAKHGARSWAYVDAVIKRLMEGGGEGGIRQGYGVEAYGRLGIYEDDTGFNYDMVEEIMQAKYDH